ncbi:IS701 family transposase [Glycomyces amatae]|uniref:IS701 family transposase n=1 Tax=Glycomyces amatae TaxID=2881355 RepID=UPI003F6E5B08
MVDDVAAEDVSAWKASLDDMFALVAGLFSRVELRRRARSYLVGLLAPVERKNSWQLAEAAGDADPWRVQHFLGRAKWDADALRDRLRSYVAANLAGPDGVLVVDETGFVKKGRRSAGVQRQYSGTAGRVENSQLGVFLAYAAPTGRALIDRELYLPASWIDDRDRCDDAGIPAGRWHQGVLTKPRLAEAMIGRALAAGVEAGWVAADSAYGRDGRFRAFLEARRMPYVVEVPVKQTVADLDGKRRVDTLIGRAPAEAWHRVSTGPGVRGERVYDWAWATVPSYGDLPAGFVRTLLARRSIDDPADIAYYLCFHPDSVERAEIVRAAGARWAIEECFQAAKGECGLDHYQVRRWEGWYRHITMAMLAHAFLAVTAATDPKAHASWEDSQSPKSAVSWR